MSQEIKMVVWVAKYPCTLPGCYKPIQIRFQTHAVDGLFSMKSDVFSFGVLVVEIAWRLWMEERAVELIDEIFR
ncbi:hypothetical protein Pint_04368 [Pistacia integerrima]|uniref:Uncharacterized protein n=1 Tax=Pistacia integerrima TaxID=434235 RepID=A0ACC0Z3R2_9ROSI|nr:hypothetical protein Pint_04368 [Pistacia integerrima]